MEDGKKTDGIDETKVESRRKFLKSAAGVATTAPAAVLLLKASTKPAKAGTGYEPALPCDGLDQGSDGTFQCIPE